MEPTCRAGCSIRSTIVGPLRRDEQAVMIVRRLHCMCGVCGSELAFDLERARAAEVPQAAVRSVPASTATCAQLTMELCGACRPEQCIVRVGCWIIRCHAEGSRSRAQRTAAKEAGGLRAAGRVGGRAQEPEAYGVCCLRESLYAVQRQVWSKRRKERRRSDKLSTAADGTGQTVKPWTRKGKLRGLLLYCKHELSSGSSCDEAAGHHRYHGCCINQQGGTSLSAAQRRSSRPWNPDVCSALNIHAPCVCASAR
jgi:hypothetical protein